MSWTNLTGEEDFWDIHASLPVSVSLYTLMDDQYIVVVRQGPVSEFPFRVRVNGRERLVSFLNEMCCARPPTPPPEGQANFWN